MTITAGRRLGRYEIRARLGAGGMGEVYLAHDTSLDRKVALKVLPDEVATNKKRMQRFTQEAKAVSALNHPNILTIHEIGETGSIHFIATEYVEGVTLRDRISSQDRLVLSEALDIAAQAASALAAAHAAGIIHRDIKPDNLMLRNDGFVKVLDFGLAKLTAPAGSETDAEAETRTRLNTEPGLIIGTVAYMSPEQSRGLKVDTRTDTWSLGVVLYEMITGRLPFEGKGIHRQIIAIQEQHPPRLSRYVDGLPERLEEIVSRMLAKDPDERYQTAKDLMIDLRNLTRKLEVEFAIERTSPPAARTEFDLVQRTHEDTAAGTSERVAPPALRVEGVRPTSSAQYIVGEIRRHKRAFTFLLVAIFATILVGGLATYLRTSGNDVPIDSIAVLPFANQGGNVDVEYLSDGLTESIISSLSQLPNFAVISRTSVFKYKGRDVDPPAIGRELKVRAVLMGTVVQRGDNLLIRDLWSFVNAWDHRSKRVMKRV